MESQNSAMNQDGLIEYIKALVLLGKFDRNDLKHINRIAEANGLQDVRYSCFVRLHGPSVWSRVVLATGKPSAPRTQQRTAIRM